MAQIARTGADKTTDTTRNATGNIAELRKRTIDQASDSAPKWHTKRPRARPGSAAGSSI
jgi:hypothetical protein